MHSCFDDDESKQSDRSRSPVRKSSKGNKSERSRGEKHEKNPESDEAQTPTPGICQRHLSLKGQEEECLSLEEPNCVHSCIPRGYTQSETPREGRESLKEQITNPGTFSNPPESMTMEQNHPITPRRSIRERRPSLKAREFALSSGAIDDELTKKTKHSKKKAQHKSDSSKSESGHTKEQIGFDDRYESSRRQKKYSKKTKKFSEEKPSRGREDTSGKEPAMVDVISLQKQLSICDINETSTKSFTEMQEDLIQGHAQLKTQRQPSLKAREPGPSSETSHNELWTPETMESDRRAAGSKPKNENKSKSSDDSSSWYRDPRTPSDPPQAVDIEQNVPTTPRRSIRQRRPSLKALESGLSSGASFDNIPTPETTETDRRAAAGSKPKNKKKSKSSDVSSSWYPDPGTPSDPPQAVDIEQNVLTTPRRSICQRRPSLMQWESDPSSGISDDELDRIPELGVNSVSSTQNKKGKESKPERFSGHSGLIKLAHPVSGSRPTTPGSSRKKLLTDKDVFEHLSSYDSESVYESSSSHPESTQMTTGGDISKHKHHKKRHHRTEEEEVKEPTPEDKHIFVSVKRLESRPAEEPITPRRGNRQKVLTPKARQSDMKLYSKNLCSESDSTSPARKLQHKSGYSGSDDQNNTSRRQKRHSKKTAKKCNEEKEQSYTSQKRKEQVTCEGEEEAGVYALQKRLSVCEIDENSRSVIETEEQKISSGDFSGSSSDYVPSCSSSDEESDNDSDDDQILQANANFSTVVSSAKQSGDLKCPFDAENYFNSHSGSKASTSGNTMKKLCVPKNEMHRLLSKIEIPAAHRKPMEELESSNSELFNDWLLALWEGFNVLLHGFGSKRSILQKFHREKLADLPVVEVNGFSSGLMMREVVRGLGECLKMEGNPSVFEIKKKMERIRDCHVFLIVHNIENLTSLDSRNVLLELASIQNFHVIASFDDVNTLLLWGSMQYTKFNFRFWNVTTFLPYVDETANENSLVMQQPSKLSLSSLEKVFKGLSITSQKVYTIIINHKLENGNEIHYQGITFSELLHLCRNDFLVPEAARLRKFIKEFVDHKVLKSKPSGEDECLSIPLDSAVLQQFLSS